MDYLNRISEDVKDAMKKQEKDRLSALRMLKSVLIENKTAAAPKAELEAITAYFKKLQSSLETYPEGNPMREKIVIEMSYLKVYLPEQMSDNEVRNIVKEIIAKNPTANVGMVMKELSPQIKGKFDGKQANTIVQELLKK